MSIKEIVKVVQIYLKDIGKIILKAIGDDDLAEKVRIKIKETKATKISFSLCSSLPNVQG